MAPHLQNFCLSYRLIFFVPCLLPDNESVTNYWIREKCEVLQCCHKAEENVKVLKLCRPHLNFSLHVSAASAFLTSNSLSYSSLLATQFGHPLSSLVFSIYSPAHFDLCYASKSSSFSPEPNRIIYCKKERNVFPYYLSPSVALHN